MSDQPSIRAYAWKEQSLAGTYWGVVAKTHLDPSEKHNCTIIMDGDGPAQPKLQRDMPEDEMKRLAEWVLWRDKMADASNEDLARALLTKGPHWGPLSDLIEIAAERLSPGIIDIMADEQEAKEDALSDLAEEREDEEDGPASLPIPTGLPAREAGSASTELFDSGRSK